MEKQDICLAVDMGGSKYMVGLVDRQGVILAGKRRAWTGLDGETVLEDVRREAKLLLEEHPQYPPGLIGATIPGLADRARGLWIEASFSGIRNLPIGRALSEAFGLHAFADNDAKACALAEKLYGAGRDVDDFLYVTVSNGIGGALFLRGRLFDGSDGTAGEIGHVTIQSGGRPCGCGSQGCLEMHAAGPGIQRNYLELGGEPNADGAPPSAWEIARRARAGDPVALTTWRLEGHMLGRAIGMACTLVNPAKVILGGGVSLSFDLFEPALNEALAQHVYRRANPALRVVPTELGYEGALLGAAAVAFCQRERLFLNEN